jgi:hypothetical protein
MKWRFVGRGFLNLFENPSESIAKLVTLKEAKISVKASAKNRNIL